MVKSVSGRKSDDAVGRLDHARLMRGEDDGRLRKRPTERLKRSKDARRVKR